MKIFQFDPTKKNAWGKDCPTLRPFSEAPLFDQILDVIIEAAEWPRSWIVFSKDEEVQINVWATMGAGTAGSLELLSVPLGIAGWRVTHFPTNMEDVEKPITSITDWSLAIKRQGLD